MDKLSLSFSDKSYPCYFDGSFKLLADLVPLNAIVITDDNIAKHYSVLLSSWQTIIIKAGEINKIQDTVNYIVSELIRLKADKQTFLIGLGGGVVTDITGYVASMYMRGIQFAFIPTSILGMVDAVVGGKNGIDVDNYKNLLGFIRQPQFILYDFAFLNTLPEDEWINGFAEIIKHACIKDNILFRELEHNTIENYKSSPEAIIPLIKKNIDIKYSVVTVDEMETGERKLLNFGHTLGHSIENIYGLPHGHAISIGMVAAALVSENLNDLSHNETERLIDLIKRYHLPTYFPFDKQRVWNMLLLDKKKSADHFSFITLQKIGEGIVSDISLDNLKIIFDSLPE